VIHAAKQLGSEDEPFKARRTKIQSKHQLPVAPVSDTDAPSIAQPDGKSVTMHVRSWSEMITNLTHKFEINIVEQG
jgi:hypothetical protein